ncbi:Asp/Glu/hydantoin racemase [Mesorhizobium sp. M1A.F.Ca.ET.072.01.1.1]|uniref:maleate cis-trans isomerase family protein n=1 Tax=Mesorhizobium sp. M1A.F.Ca.ET.072.01.1.1 TaxID=2496753 RepID=UPI000FD54623|nr:Asp/Glu/hydantoin racemase [Mesorhizobium sp. M1A.F.Ca.ET.072.01.1.1]RUW49845.1 Asp/Glu/hydantoin racemase [Mesorhizobium sp. M1A.F.Ca.ET.072.01.1.1]TIU71802.1 MAG: Asp/Glu/hydantoin racemase [Mesorhizobium sp.]TIV04254.1 MAG: Asp/Glu/hydantoin racemase [Mesorhizobium sp.]
MEQSLELPTKRRFMDVDYELDSGFGSRAHIGMVVISNDQTLSHEARAMLQLPGVALYESRVLAARQKNEAVTMKLLRKQADDIDLAVRQINNLRPSDVVALGCTSAAMIIGPDELCRRIRNVYPHASVTDPFSGIVAALRALSSQRIAYVSPYPRDIAETMIMNIEATGREVVVGGSFHDASSNIGDEAPFISPASIDRAVRHVIDGTDVDTVVIACTQMRAASVIGSIEKQTGKHVITSNQALCWHALRLAGCDDSVLGWGRLFEIGLALDAN